MYVSYASESLTDSELNKLLETCRKNNLKRNITGMLMYIDGNIIQVLEGAKNDIDEMYDTIVQDSRHKKVSKIIEGRCVDRNFEKWTMGFKSFSTSDEKEKEGFSQIEKYFRNLEINDSSHVTLVFLRLFYKKYYKKFELAEQ